MGAQPSSPSSRAAGGNGGSLRMLGSTTKAAPFAPTSEPTGTHSQKWGRSLGSRSARSSSSGDLDLGLCDLEAGSPPSPQAASTKQTLLPFSEQAAPSAKSLPDSMERRPSKMSVTSFESNEDSTPSVASQAESRPTSAQSRRSFGASRSNSSGFNGGSRPASAQSRLGAKPKARDPAFIQAERLAKLSLEKLEQQEFIGGKKAWGGYTPSTVSGDNFSRATSSVSSSTCGSRPTTSSSSVFSSTSSQGPNVNADLKDAQKRAKASAAALLSELKGSASATPARYSTWPIGCALRIATDGRASNLGGSVVDDGSESEGLFGSLVRYDRVQNTFEVKLDDGSVRTVPAQRVNRARPRDRANANAPRSLAASTASRSTAEQHEVPTTDHSNRSGASSALLGSMHGPSGSTEKPFNMFDSSFHEELPLHSQKHSRRQDMPVQSLESGSLAYSPNRLQPQTLGHPFGGLDFAGPYDLEHTPPSPNKSDPPGLVADCFGRAHSVS